MIRWGILGCGDVTEVKSGPAFAKVPNSSLVAVMRRDRAKAEDYARRHGVKRAYSEASELIGCPEVDAVYIATPPGSHHDLTLAALAAGKPVYVEKPMARNHREAIAMVQAAKRAQKPLFVAYYRRALDRFVNTKRLLDSGRLGRVSSVAMFLSGPQQLANLEPPPWRVQPEFSGAGLFLDLASHMLDLIDFWFGPVQAQGIARRTRATGPEDHVVLHFETDSDVIGSAHFNFVSPVAADRTVILGDQGQLSLSIFGTEPVELTTTAGVERFEWTHPAHVEEPLITSVVAALHGTGDCPSTGESGARTSLVMDRVLEGFYGGRNDDFWLRPHTWAKR